MKLDSCNPAVLARPPRRPKDIEEAAERNRTRADLERYDAILTTYAEGDTASSVESVLGLSGTTSPERAASDARCSHQQTRYRSSHAVGRPAVRTRGHAAHRRRPPACRRHLRQRRLRPVPGRGGPAATGRQVCARSRSDRWRRDGMSRFRAFYATASPCARRTRCSNLDGSVWRTSPRSSARAACWRSPSRRSTPCADGHQAVMARGRQSRPPANRRPSSSLARRRRDMAGPGRGPGARQRRGVPAPGPGARASVR